MRGLPTGTTGWSSETRPQKLHCQQEQRIDGAVGPRATRQNRNDGQWTTELAAYRQVIGQPSCGDGILPNGTDPGNLPHWTGSNWSVSSTALDYDGNNLALNDNQIRFRGASDGNHTLGFLGGAFDGPLLQGFSSVVLKTVTGGDAGGLFLKNSRIGIGTTNPTNGRLHVESSFGVGFSYGYLNGGGNTGYW